MTPWPEKPMHERSLRVAMTGVVHDDDPEIIADMQNEIGRLRATLREIEEMAPATQEITVAHMMAQAARTALSN